MDALYHKIGKNDNCLTNNHIYRQGIGKLLNLATITRPDILTAINILSRKNKNSTEVDWKALKRVMQYLNATKNLNLIINTENAPILEAYSDAN